MEAFLMKVANNIAEMIGETQSVKLKNERPETQADVSVKLEVTKPGSTVKDRIALSMSEAAESEGVLKAGDTIVEPTSGNTGIGIAMVAAAKGYRTVIVMPDTMSQERRNLLRAFGAELVLTPGSEGMKGAIAKAEQLEKEHGYFMTQKFNNMANAKVNARTTVQ